MAFFRTYPLAPASIACRTHVLSRVHAEHENGGVRRVFDDLARGVAVRSCLEERSP